MKSRVEEAGNGSRQRADCLNFPFRREVTARSAAYEDYPQIRPHIIRVFLRRVDGFNIAGFTWVKHLPRPLDVTFGRSDGITLAMTFDPHAIETPALRQAYDYWDTVRGHRLMPARRDIDPTRMIPWLPNTFLVDVSYQPLEFRFRLVGTEVVHRFGMEITGRRLRELNLHGREHQTRSEYAAVVRDRAPRYSVDLTRGRDSWEIERLLMPLSQDGETVNMLFGVQHAVTAYKWETGLSAV